MLRPLAASVSSLSSIASRGWLGSGLSMGSATSGRGPEGVGSSGPEVGMLGSLEIDAEVRFVTTNCLS